MRRARSWQGFLWLALCCVPAIAAAHKESDAFLRLSTNPASGHVLDGQWDIALRDLDFALGIDSNHDGAITWGEVEAHRGAIERYALARLAVKGDGLTCDMWPFGQKIDEHTDGAYDVIFFRAVCDKEIPGRLTLVYRLFDDVDPYHRGIVTVRARGHTASAVLGPENPSISLNLRKPDRWGQFRSFVIDGMWHIWTGIDHLLFLISLLLPAVLTRRREEVPDEWAGGSPPRRALLLGGALRLSSVGAGGAALEDIDSGGAAGMLVTTPTRFRYRWEAVPSWWPAFIDVVKVISAFTLSHSVTLSLAVLGIVDLPSRLVESGIALSIIVAAGNNLVPIVRERVWLIAFAFGFIHGLGFASALSGLELPPLAMAASLGGFNVGVEIGQETIVLAIMPLAFLLRRTRFYQVVVLRFGSLIIIAMATGWLIQRAADILIPGFGAILPR